MSCDKCCETGFASVEHGGFVVCECQKLRQQGVGPVERAMGVIGPGEVAPAKSRSSGHLTALERKQRPLCTGVLDYFPDALMEVAYCSFIGNEQHNPGEPLHWAKEKSTDEPDALMRHLKDRGKFDSDGVRHSAKVAWRALAMLQREIDAEKIKGQVA